MTQQPPSGPGELEQLRQLLLRPELEQIKELRRQLESREQFAEKVGEVLPRAFNHSSEKDEELSQAMVPTVEQIIRESIKRDMNRFAEALFPVIGPSIRKAISEAIRQMVQSMNQMLDNSLSIQGLRWRFEALRTSSSFAEVVMLHSLVYRVEQVFLIHRETGLLLQHLQNPDSVVQDADLVSSMLSAIGDFVGDSFAMESDAGLETVQFGDLTLWLQHGPQCLMAIAIRGDAPHKLKELMQETLETIEFEFSELIARFDGDTSDFVRTQPYLEKCLKSQWQKPAKKGSWLTRVVWLVVFTALGYWLFLHLQQNWREQQYLELLQQQPGYVITDHYHRHGRWIVAGLRDPLSTEPQQLLSQTALNSARVEHQFRPYQSLEPSLVEQRLRRLLQAPANVRIEIQGSQLILSGYASENWLQQFQQQILVLAGVTSIDSQGLKHAADLSALQAPASVALDLDLNSGVLRLNGIASREWLQQAQQRSQSIDAIQEIDDSQLKLMPDVSQWPHPASVQLRLQGQKLIISGQADSAWINGLEQQLAQHPEITSVDLDALQNLDQLQLQQAISRLRHIIILFDQSESISTQGNSLEQASQTVLQMFSAAHKLGLNLGLRINGFSDSFGRFSDNQTLSRQRAQFVAQFLISRGVEAQRLEIRGIQQPVAQESTAAERRFNRRVSFEVIRPGEATQ